jgi:RsiW-degrading membrane proteinase PrsW (M82 family)
MYGVPIAVAPGIAIIFFIYFRDKKEKEPIRLLWICFLLGVLSIIPAAIYEFLFNLIGFKENHNLTKTLFYAFGVVAFAEELSKFFILRIFIYRKPAFNEPFDGIVYSIMVSMGFATIENIFYVLSGGIQVGLLRMFTSVPLHAACAVFMGYYLGNAKFSKSPVFFMLTGILIAIVIHGLFDFFLIQQEVKWLAVFSLVTLAGGVGFSFRAIYHLQKRSLLLKTDHPEKENSSEKNQSSES